MTTATIKHAVRKVVSTCSPSSRKPDNTDNTEATSTIANKSGRPASLQATLPIPTIKVTPATPTYSEWLFDPGLRGAYSEFINELAQYSLRESYSDFLDRFSDHELYGYILKAE